MEILPTPVFSAPFDAVAERYDETFTDSAIGRAQRAAVWSTLDKTFCAGDRVLEIGCGTGIDACYLAERGVTVTACDNSPRMIELTTRRAQLQQKEAFIDARVLAAEQLDDLSAGAFDGAFSNFGAMNCVRDPAIFASSLAHLLHPGAIALLCWMGPCCLWEILFYLARGDRSKAFRRFHRGGLLTRLGDGPPIRVMYPSVHSLTRAFAPHFRLRSVSGIGVFVPPTYCERWARRLPGLLRLAEQADAVFGTCPGTRVLADHVLLCFERKSSER